MRGEETLEPAVGNGACLRGLDPTVSEHPEMVPGEAAEPQAGDARERPGRCGHVDASHVGEVDRDRSSLRSVAQALRQPRSHAPVKCPAEPDVHLALRTPLDLHHGR